MDNGQGETSTLADKFRVLLHPVLDEPELAAASADVVLARRVKDAGFEPELTQPHPEVACELALADVRRGNGFVALADDRDSRLPDRRVEELS